MGRLTNGWKSQSIVRVYVIRNEIERKLRELENGREKKSKH